MSHFRILRTQIREVDALVKALAELGFRHVEVHETVGALRSWLREGRAQSASFQEVEQAVRQFVPLEITSG